MEEKYLEIPQALNDCFETDKTADKVKEFSLTISKIGSFIAFVISAIGVVSAIIGSAVPEKVFLMFGSTENEYTVFYFFIVAGGWLLVAFLFRVVIQWFSSVLLAQSQIIQNTNTLAKFELYHLSKLEKNEPDQIQIAQQHKENGFCVNCGSRFPDDAKFCVSCGQKKM